MRSSRRRHMRCTSKNLTEIRLKLTCVSVGLQICPSNHFDARGLASASPADSSPEVALRQSRAFRPTSVVLLPTALERPGTIP
jgi:hypothetical protein